MSPKDPRDPSRETRTEPHQDEHKKPNPKAVPPIEREHETQAGVAEEDERRQRERP